MLAFLSLVPTSGEVESSRDWSGKAVGCWFIQQVHLTLENESGVGGRWPPCNKGLKMLGVARRGPHGRGHARAFLNRRTFQLFFSCFNVIIYFVFYFCGFCGCWVLFVVRSTLRTTNSPKASAWCHVLVLHSFPGCHILYMLKRNDQMCSYTILICIL